MAGEDVISTLLQIKLDTNATAQAKAGLKGLKSDVLDLNTSTNQTNSTVVLLSRKISEVQRANQIDKLARDMAAYGDEILTSSEKAEKLAEQLEAIGASQQEINQAAKAYASYGMPNANGPNIEGIRRTGGALNQLLPGVGVPVQLLGDLQQVSKELTAVAGAGEFVEKAAAALVPVLGATAGGFVAALAPLAAVGVALAPLLIALKILADREAAAAESAKQLADVYSAQADAFAVGQEALINRNAETQKVAVQTFNDLNDTYRKNVEKIMFLKDQQSKSDEKTAAEIQKTIDSTITEQTKLSGSIDILRGNLAQLGVVVTGTAPGLSKVVEGISHLFKDILGVVGKLSEEAQTKLKPLANAFQNALELAQKRADKEVSIVNKLNSDLTTIDQKAADDREAIGKKLADTLISINEKAVENAQQILDDLEKQQAANALKLTRADATALDKANFDQTQRQIEFQRATVSNLKRHLADLKRIQEDADDAMREDALDRNFAQLAKDKRDLAKNLSRSNEDYNAEEQARLEAARNKNEDDQRQYLFEHEQRVKAFQQENADAIAAANAALKQNENAAKKARVLAQNQANQDYSDLTAKLNKEHDAKLAGAKADLELVFQTEAAKQQAYAASLKQAQDILNGVVSAGSSGGSTQNIPILMASGGNLGAGRFALVNEPGSSGRESFSAGGTTARFPGMGVFMPYKSGQVNANRGGDTFNISPTFNITGGAGSEQKIVDLVDQRLETTVKRIFRTRT